MNSNVKYSTLAAWPLAICRALEANDIDPEPLLKSCGMNREAFINNPDSRVDIQLMTRFWDTVLHETRDESFGLIVGQYALPMHFRALGLLMHTTDSLENALQKLGQYSALVSNSAMIRIEQTPTSLGFCIDPIAGVAISSLAVDSFFATLTQFILQLGAKPPLVEQVELQKSPPRSPQLWEQFFRAPVVFGADQNALWLRRSQLKTSLIMGDDRLAAYNESLVQDYVKHLATSSLSHRVKHLILACMDQGEPPVADIADRLNLTERSLRRHLKEEGVTFREILQQCRMEMADYYLTRTELPITDIAMRLGFADASNFTRAFARWFAKSPSEFRKSDVLS